jgi:hypothetical protein
MPPLVNWRPPLLRLACVSPTAPPCAVPEHNPATRNPSRLVERFSIPTLSHDIQQEQHARPPRAAPRARPGGEADAIENIPGWEAAVAMEHAPEKATDAKHAACGRP